jgi:nucleoside 2-deoxyribosyltransferase
MITGTVMADVAQLPPPNMLSRLDNFLRTGIELVNFEVGKGFTIVHPRMLVACYCLSRDEIRFLQQYWEGRGALKSYLASPTTSWITAEGFLIFEETHRALGRSNQAFVAMWFNSEVQVAYEDGIAAGIRSAGYEPLRIDKVEHEGRIDDRIIAEIRRSRIVVADFTGHRGGVYYEAGFAHGLGLPVIFCCREDHFKELHFDVRQYNTIIWTDANSLRRQLHNRLLARFGAGPTAPNAATIPQSEDTDPRVQ